jgi:hypothetical protein
VVDVVRTGSAAPRVRPSRPDGVVDVPTGVSLTRRGMLGPETQSASG